MDLSSAVLIRYLPFGWKKRSVIQLSCPVRITTQRPDFTSNILIFLSLDPVAMKSRTFIFSCSSCSFSCLLVSICIDVSPGRPPSSSPCFSSSYFSSTISPRNIFFFISNYAFNFATRSLAVSLLLASIRLSSSCARLWSLIWESSSKRSLSRVWSPVESSVMS